MACPDLANRCGLAAGGNPMNEAYLLHGTHPTMAVAILGRSFTIDTAGKSVGTMFGPGVYLAESSTKADEYARHDEGGEYDGLYALLMVRAVLGRPFVTLEAGNFMDKVLSEEYGHVLGDREKAVGTFREFIFFHESSIYPEYAIFYRREAGGEVIVPPRAATAPVMESMDGMCLPSQVQDETEQGPAAAPIVTLTQVQVQIPPGAQPGQQLQVQ